MRTNLQDKFNKVDEQKERGNKLTEIRKNKKEDKRIQINNIMRKKKENCQPLLMKT